MKRVAVTIGLVLALGMAVLALWASETKPTVVRAGTLPVTRIVLFASGVAYYERMGEVEGDVRVDLTFPVEDINDLLKSMVLQDLNGGKIRAVGYDSQEPLDRSLKSYAVNLSSNPTFAQVLGQVRGEKVEVVLQNSSAPLRGTVMGVEKKMVLVEKGPAAEVETLNLWCEEGLRGIKLADVQRVRFLNPKLEEEVKKALELLATSHDTQKKAVSLLCTGSGKRTIRVGYVIGAPVWKTSYRLVSEPNGKALLQGWSMVENTSEEDWVGIDLRLVSGKPFSFRMDLYRPLYVERPKIEMDLTMNRPVTHEPGTPPRNWRDGKDKDSAPAFKDVLKDDLRTKDKGPATPRPEPLNISQGIDVRAMGEKVGDYFQYKIDGPVSMPRQKSAMLPILNERIEVKRVSVFNEGTNRRNPTLAMKVKNTSKLHLMQGPITVFEGDNYAGDAHILGVQPGEERLVSYGIDPSVEVSADEGTIVSRITQMRLVKGVMQSTVLHRMQKVYTMKNRADEARTLLIEHPYRTEFKLTGTVKPVEQTATLYRFEMKLDPDKAVTLNVTEEQTVAQLVTLTNTEESTIRFFLSSSEAGPELKAALEVVMERKAALTTADRDLQRLQNDLRDLTEDQTRIRANIERAPKDSDAYKRYLKKFDEQEPLFEKSQQDIRKQRLALDKMRNELDDFLTKLTAE